MKAIIALSDIETESSTAVMPIYKYAVIPDSSIVRAKDPFFKPDDGSWFGMTLRGVIIDRLGKGISIKYASRYYNNCITAVHPFTHLDPMFAAVERWSRDGALVVSPPKPVGEQNREILDVINNIIYRVSLFLTLKTGDLVLYGDADKTFCLENKSKDYIIPSYAGFPEMKLKIR